MSVKDIIKKSVLESFSFNQSITLQTILQISMALIVSFLMGLLIYAIYRKFFCGVVFCRTFGITLIGMTVLTSMVTLAISTNVVISLGMVGALSIVRFRTAVKDPIDLLYLFWAVSTGITVGANMYILSAAGALIMVFMLWLICRRQDTRRAFMLIVSYNGSAEEIEKLLCETPHTLKSKTMRAEISEAVYDITIKRGNDAFTENLRALANVNNVTLVEYNGEYHA